MALPDPKNSQYLHYKFLMDSYLQQPEQQRPETSSWLYLQRLPSLLWLI